MGQVLAFKMEDKDRKLVLVSSSLEEEVALFRDKVKEHQQRLEEVYSIYLKLFDKESKHLEDLSHSQRKIHLFTRDISNPFSRESREIRETKRKVDFFKTEIEKHYKSLPDSTKERFKVLVEFDLARFAEFNYALIGGVSQIGNLTHNQSVYLCDYIQRESRFSVPFIIIPVKKETRYECGHYNVEIYIPLPSDEVKPDNRDNKDFLTVKAFVKDFNAWKKSKRISEKELQEEKRREEYTTKAAEIAGIPGPRLLHSYKNIIIYQFAEERNKLLDAVRSALT